MELINQYLSKSHFTSFIRVKEIWEKEKVKGTPEMASIIERHNISRHNYREYISDEQKVQTKEEYYRYCLALLIYAIDVQSFDVIGQIFEAEHGLMTL